MNSQGKEGPDDGDSACKGPAGKVTGSKEACVAGKGLRSGESGAGSRTQGVLWSRGGDWTSCWRGGSRDLTSSNIVALAAAWGGGGAVG